jgi:hypothetical protein
LKKLLITISALLVLFSAVYALPVVDSLTIGAFTIDATNAPAVTVKPPARPGTLAVTADIITAAPSVPMVAGQATLAGGSVTITFTAISASVPICVATDVSAASPVRRGAVTSTSVTFEGVSNHVIEYICTVKNN